MRRLLVTRGADLTTEVPQLTMELLKVIDALLIDSVVSVNSLTIHDVTSILRALGSKFA